MKFTLMFKHSRTINMSENIIAASKLNFLIGNNVISVTASNVFTHTKKAIKFF